MVDAAVPDDGMAIGDARYGAADGGDCEMSTIIDVGSVVVVVAVVEGCSWVL